MRSGRGQRCAALVAALAVSSSACSLIVSTTGLAGGDGPDADGQLDSGGGSSLGSETSLDDAGADGENPGNSDGPTSIDSSTPYDASGVGDTSAPDQGAGHDGSTDPNDGATDAGHVSHPGDAGPTCSGDLSNIGAGDFVVSFTLRTTQSGSAALLNQRSTCMPGTFWDVRLASGEIEIETDDIANDTNYTGSGPNLDDGASHTVVVERVKGTITILVDKAVSGSTASLASFGALPTLATGSDVCDGQDGTSAFQGTLSIVCIGTL